MPQAKELAVLLGFTIQEEALVLQAMTHSSFLNDRAGELDNERLEFLGDAVLDLLCSQTLFDLFPDLSEGQLSRLRAFLVRESTLAEIARGFALAKFLRLGKSALRSGGYERPKILAGLVESLLGAAFLCGGLPRAKVLYELFYSELLSQATELWAEADPKSALQELAPESVKYVLLAETGPDHDRSYRMEVFVKGVSQGMGDGKSKKQAEQAAARAALRKLQAKV